MAKTIEDILKESPTAQKQFNEFVETSRQHQVKEQSINPDYQISPQNTPNQNIKPNSKEPNLGKEHEDNIHRIDAVDKALNKTDKEKEHTKEIEKAKSKELEH